MEHQLDVQRNKDLAGQLDAYAASVRANTAGWKERLRGWTPYAAAVGSGLALTTAADAGIIYSGVQDVQVSLTASGTIAIKRTTQAFHMKVGGTGANSAFSLRLTYERNRAGSHGSHLNTFGAAQLRPVPPAAALVSSGNRLRKLNSGDKISGGAGKFRTYGFDYLDYKRQVFFTSGIQFGKFNAGQTGFAGVRFTQADGQHFGWIRL